MRDPEMTEPEEARPGDALDELVGFHATIRSELEALRALGDGAAEPARADVLRIAGFFTDGIALHDLDEEASLLPRLRQAKHPERLDRMIQACTSAHERLESTLEANTPYLVELARGEATFDRERVRKIHAAISNVLEPHLRMEELEIMPMARLLLSSSEIHALGVEMHARRDARRDHHPRVIALDP